MASPQATPVAQRRLTWMIGGFCLIADGLLLVAQLVTRNAAGHTALWAAGTVLFGAALVLFAIGMRRDESIVARRPAGVTALMVLALWPLIDGGIAWWAGPAWTAIDAPEAAPAAYTIYSYVSLLVPAAAAFIAVIQIGRARVVPRPWRWAPAWVLGALVLAQGVPQIVYVIAGPGAFSFPPFISVVSAAQSIALLASTIGLGAVAVALARAPRTGSAPVRPPGVPTAR